jgi:hypothetical protein
MNVSRFIAETARGNEKIVRGATGRTNRDADKRKGLG